MTIAHLRTSLREVFGDPLARLAFPTASAIFFALSILLLVVTIPGNTISFQLSILTPRDYLLLVLLAFLLGLHAAVQTHALRARRRQTVTHAVTHGVVSGSVGLFAASIGTAACASCIASLFGLVGLGMSSVLFVLAYRVWFFAGAIAVALVSLYVSLRRLESPCLSCVPP